VARLRNAIVQLDCWRRYVETDLAELVKQLRADAKKYGIGPRGEPREPTCNAGLHITDPLMSLHFRYQIVIGRRAKLSPEDLERKAVYKNSHSAELVTYDRLIDTAVALERKLRPGENLSFPITTE
jgi:hypothetical protein